MFLVAFFFKFMLSEYFFYCFSIDWVENLLMPIVHKSVDILVAIMLHPSLKNSWSSK